MCCQLSGKLKLVSLYRNTLIVDGLSIRKMRPSIVLLLSLLTFVTIASQVVAQHEIDNFLVIESPRSSFKLPNLVSFEQFKKLFKKVYRLQMENLVRARLYVARTLKAFSSAVNYKYGLSSSYLAINQMSDWLPEQVKRTILGPDDMKGIELIPMVSVDQLMKLRETHETLNGTTPIQLRQKRSPKLENPIVGFLYKNIHKHEQTGSIARHQLRQQSANVIFTDNRKCLSPVKNQADCGSCWIFSVLALYEWNYCSIFREKVQFSEQYALDCGKQRFNLQGCKGGFFNQMRDFVQEFGVELTSRYPYKALNGRCPYEPTTPSANMGLLRFTDDGFVGVHLNQVERYLSLAPVIMVLFLNDKFHEYGGGVDDAIGCSDQSVHAVLAVGSGREDGKEYWLIRNSFGPLWGESGHYKLNKRSACVYSSSGFVLNNPVVPTTRNINYLAEPIDRKQLKAEQARANLAHDLSKPQARTVRNWW